MLSRITYNCRGLSVILWRPKEKTMRPTELSKMCIGKKIRRIKQNMDRTFYECCAGTLGLGHFINDTLNEQHYVSMGNRVIGGLNTAFFGTHPYLWAKKHNFLGKAGFQSESDILIIVCMRYCILCMKLWGSIEGQDWTVWPEFELSVVFIQW